ncbi:MAG: hypothetical protein IIZ10_05890 [Solobacterium sp.]|nr:hypothetical protein [Solobacterium sp.]
MLLNLIIIGCFILSAVLVYAAVSIMMDFAIPEPLRHRYVRRLPKRIMKYLHARQKKLRQFFKSDSETARTKVQLKELHH